MTDPEARHPEPPLDAALDEQPEPPAGQVWPASADEMDGEQLRQRTRGQIEVIRRAFGKDRDGQDVVEVASQTAKDEDFDYLYRRQALLCRDRDVPAVRAALLAAVEGSVEVEVENLVAGLSRVVFRSPQRVPDVLDRLDAALGVGVVTPDHVVHVTSPPGGGLCPATEPALPPAPAPVPSPVTPPGGRAAFVSVVDTGWHGPAAADPATPWLSGVTGDDEQLDLSDLRAYAGHGTFVAGVVRCLAPGSRVRVEGFLPHGGAILEADMIVQLRQALNSTPDVINLSAGTRTRKNVPSLGFQVFWESYLSRVPDTVLVAAAGNDHTSQPFWPAAFDWAVGVGALDGARRRARFSNFGSWVDVYALGEDLVNAFPRGTYQCKEPPNKNKPPREFQDLGLARWSGTSFAAPVVAGKIAARMSKTGQNARQATAQLLAEARANAIPGVGPVL